MDHDKETNNNRKRLASQTVITGGVGGGEESCPPNRKVQKMDHKEREKILRRAAEESKRSFQLRPHQSWSTPLLNTYIRQQHKGPLPFPYPSLGMATPSAGTPLSTTPSVVPEVPTTYQRPPSFPRPVARQQESDDEDDTDNNTHRPSAPPTESTDTSGGDKIPYTPSTQGMYPRIYSPAHLPSPFLYMYNCSPLSPLLLVSSPSCPIPSIGSIPSVESSSGCSSMSEGGHEKEPVQAPPTMRVAPDEYHVGVTLPQTDQSDEESNPPSPIEGVVSSATENEIIDVTGGIHQPLAPPLPPRQPLAPPLPPSHRPVIANSSLMSNPPTYVPSHASGNPSNYNPIINGLCTSNTVIGGVQGGASTCTPTTGLPNYQINTNSNERRSSGISVSPTSSRGSTPEPIGDTSDQRDLYQASSDPEELFCLVPGRLSLLSATQKYKVTLDEVRRRLSGPECLNASVLGGILRRAKSKNGGHHLRQRLEAKGLSLPAGRRKQTELFLLTSLVEGEAVHLAEDFRRLCDNYFPHSELAHIIGGQHINTPHIERRISMVQAAQVLIQELQAMVETVGGPNNLRPDDPTNPYPGLTNFSLLSHGFGNPNISTSLSVVQNYFSELLKVYEGNKPGMPVEFQPSASAPFPTPPTGSGNFPLQPQMGGTNPRPKIMKKEKRESLPQCSNESR